LLKKQKTPTTRQIIHNGVMANLMLGFGVWASDFAAKYGKFRGKGAYFNTLLGFYFCPTFAIFYYIVGQRSFYERCQWNIDRRER